VEDPAILASACAGSKAEDKQAYGVDDVDRGARTQKAEGKHAYGVDDVDRGDRTQKG